MMLPAEPSWERAVSDLELGPGEVHIWYSNWSSLSSKVDDWKAMLSPDELARVDAFRFQKDADRFIARRGLLRTILAAYCVERPSEISFGYNANGKPRLNDNALSSVGFSISSSTDLVLIALARDEDIGVDVEFAAADFPMIEIAEKHFTPSEISEVAAASGDRRALVFYSFWTQKEAYVKAIGANLVDELPKGSGIEGWEYYTFAPEASYVASIVTRNLIRKKRFIKWDDDPRD